MNIDLKEIPIRNINYDGNVEIPKEYYENTGVLDFKNVHLKFSIVTDSNQDDILDLECNGVMVLEDARSLDAVDYPFFITFHEFLNEESEICGRFLTNSQNTLDILSILWENIVLEIPISFTVSDEVKKSSEWYRIGGEESNDTVDPRLAPLMELLDKEKE